MAQSSSRAGPFSSCDFGTACARGRGRPRSFTPSAPSGLSAVSQISSSCLPSWLAVTAFPPPEAFPWVTTAFRQPCGTTRSSDSSRPFAISPFVLSGYRLFRGGREVSPGKNTQLPPTPSSLRAPLRRISGFARRWPAHPRAARLSTLRFRSVQRFTSDFHQTSPRGLARAAPLARTWSSRSTPLSPRCWVPSVRVP